MSHLTTACCSRIMLSLLMTVPCSVVVSFFIIELFKLKEALWPKVVLRSAAVLFVGVFALL